MLTNAPQVRARRLHSLLARFRRLIHVAAKRRYVAHWDHVLGTSLELQVSVRGAKSAERVETAVLAEVGRLERIFSTHAEASELLSWMSGDGSFTPVSEELAEVLEAAARWRELTRGAFEPRVRGGPPREPRLPYDASGGSSVSGRAGPGAAPPWRLEPRGGDDPPRAAIRPGTILDLDGIAKGYIVDRACQAGARAAGAGECMVNIGGDLRHIGSRFVVASVTDPVADAENAAPLARIRLRNQGLATSGGYRRRSTLPGGATGSHIHDRRTGGTADSILSASVLAKCAMTADALATAFNVLSPAESVRLADSLSAVGCLIVTADGAVHRNHYWESHEF